MAKELSVPRNQWAIRLSMAFTNDYDEMIKHYKQPQQEELTEHLIGMLNVMYDYVQTNRNEDYERYVKSENDLQKKYGKAFEPFASKHFYMYFRFEMIVVHKNVITTEEYNNLPHSEEQTLKPEEIRAFVQLSLNYLYHSRNRLWAQREPEFETSLAGTGETSAKTKTKGIPKRQAGDNLTRLNQEQSVLLFHYLRKWDLILKDEYLNNTQAGEAVSILTGYSANALRQNFSKNELERIGNKENLLVVEKAVTNLMRLIKGDVDRSK